MKRENAPFPWGGPGFPAWAASTSGSATDLGVGWGEQACDRTREVGNAAETFKGRAEQALGLPVLEL